MPLQLGQSLGLSEYKRNFKWRKSDPSKLYNPSYEHKCQWAGLRSDELGISKEPNFISKRRVPYYNTQVSKSFEWNGDNDSEKDASSELEFHQPPEQHRKDSKDDINHENIKTPDAPRLPEKTHSNSVGSRSESTVTLSERKKSPPKTSVHENGILASTKKDDGKSDNGLDKVLQRKAGMNISRSSSFPRSSEYQRQFVWKTPQKLSPVLAADKNERKETFSKTIGNSSKQSKAETKKKHCKQKLKPPCLHRSLRKINTEYRSNFLPPTQYMYKDGAWLRIRRNMPDQVSMYLNSWNVKELREKAEAYRQRIRGTHFSREHLNQILSDNNRLWDVSSDSSTEETISNNVKALDLAGIPEKNLSPSPQILPKPEWSEQFQQNNTGKLGFSDAATVPVKRKLAWGEPGNVQELEVHSPALGEGEEKENKQESEEVEEQDQKYQNTNADNQQEENMNSPGDRTDSPVPSREGGRLPTPELRAIGGAQRTHHDLTTPTAGGAVLVSPPKVKSSSSLQIRKELSEKYGLTNNQGSREDLKRKFNRVRHKTISLGHSSAAGLKTLDPLPLRKDHWPSQNTTGVRDHPTSVHLEKTTIVPGLKSAKDPALPYWSPLCRIKGTLRNPEFQHNGNVASPQRSWLQLPLHEKNYNPEDDDDRLSQLSVRSAASSSLASQVLERAQRRKENFWSKL
uniref:Nuclear protein MDM1 n=1 Tax=Varanus komodoensis TaxID=61221 RepID=A0A8D2IN81_VARKO